MRTAPPLQVVLHPSKALLASDLCPQAALSTSLSALATAPGATPLVGGGMAALRACNPPWSMLLTRRSMQRAQCVHR